MLDADKKPLANSIVWNCGRAVAYEAIIAEQISAEDYQTHTGMQLSPLWTAAKIAWLRDNEPTLFEQGSLVRQWAGIFFCTVLGPMSG